MKDIVNELREHGSELSIKAADEIERLRKTRPMGIGTLTPEQAKGISNKLNSTRRNQLAQELVLQFSAFFTANKLNLELRVGPHKISLVERIHTIQDIWWGLAISIPDLNDLSWAKEQLRIIDEQSESDTMPDELYFSLIDSDTYSDREMINDRYGF